MPYKERTEVRNMTVNSVNPSSVQTTVLTVEQVGEKVQAHLSRDAGADSAET